MFPSIFHLLNKFVYQTYHKHCHNMCFKMFEVISCVPVSVSIAILYLLECTFAFISVSIYLSMTTAHFIEMPVVTLLFLFMTCFSLSFSRVLRNPVSPLLVSIFFTFVTPCLDLSLSPVTLYKSLHPNKALFLATTHNSFIQAALLMPLMTFLLLVGLWQSHPNDFIENSWNCNMVQYK